MTRPPIYEREGEFHGARMIPQIHATQFPEQVIASTVPVLVEFFTDRCFHCQQLLPVLAEVAQERPDSIRILKFDGGAEPEFASRFRINSVPNLILFQGGQPIAQRSGFWPKRDLVVWIDGALGQGKGGTAIAK